MKKAKLLLIIFTCGLLAACGKNNDSDVESTELDISEIEVVQDDFSYTYTEQKDGSLIFTIEGKWDRKQEWSILPMENAVATVEEVSQTNKKTEYHFTAQKEMSGYSEYAIHLSNTQTNKIVYKVMFSVIADTDGKLSVLNIYGYTPSDKKVKPESGETGTGVGENTGENPTIEELSEDKSYSNEEKADKQKKEEAYDELVGDVFIPEELVVGEKKTDTFEGKAIGRTNLEYKENIFMCTIAPSISVSDIKMEIDTKKEAWKTKKIGETEVHYCEQKNDLIIVWSYKDGISIVLSGRNVENDIAFEVVKLMLGNE